MHAPRHPRLLRRQDDPFTAPDAVGITNAGVTIANTAGANPTGLAFDTAVTGVPTPVTAPPLAPTLPVVTNTENLPAPSANSVPTDSTPVSATSTKPIAISTVVASCVGAFIGASLLIVFAVWMYRRYSRSLKQRGRHRSPYNSSSRNAHGNDQRRRSRLEPWNRLEDGDDKWEGMYHNKDAPRETETTEKLNMFKKTPSVRTAYTHKSTDASALSFPNSYADFDPKLAESLNVGKADMAQPRQFLGRIEHEPISWDSDPAHSYLSVHSRMSGSMSPTLGMAIPTPPAVSRTHRWESAEVVQYSEAQSAEVVNPFADESRRSAHNPFFGGTPDTKRHTRNRSTSSSVRSRSNSRTRSRSNSIARIPASAKGKEKMRYSTATAASNTANPDPFDDINEQMPARPAFMTHTVNTSTSSMGEQEKQRALQSLIAALEVPEAEIRDRLRIASMQPSIISQTSSIGPEEPDVTKEFPLPPGSSPTRP